MDININQIKIKERARKDLGDLAALAASIEQIGLLHPIGISSDYTLLFGERRLRAFEMLGRDTIPVSVLDIPSLALAEHAENEIRKDFTPSERVAIAQAIEAEIGNRRGQRTDLGKGELVPNWAQVPGQKTREIAAEKAGFDSRNSYLRAKTVVATGTPELIEAMDRGDVAISTAATLATAPVEIQLQAVADPEKAIEFAKQASQAKVKEIRQISAEEGRKHTNRTVLFTGNEEWYTPKEYIEAAREVLGNFDLDPASNPIAQETVQAQKYYTAEDDGLSKDWIGKLWINPPYSHGVIDKFITKLVQECSNNNVKEAIVLTNNCTDTGWFHACLNISSALCFTKGRINFYAADGKKSSPTQGQTFFYLGRNHTKFSNTFEKFGVILDKYKN